MTQFGDYTKSIYLAGFGGQVPSIPVDWRKLAEMAEEGMAERDAGYVFGSAGDAATDRANRAAFEAWRIVPRMLRDVAVRDLSTSPFGSEWPAPLALAPVGAQGIVHEEGERATAQGASRLGVPITVGTLSSHTLEALKDELGDTPGMFQLYWPTDPELAESFVTRAEAAGYEAIMVTVDNAFPGWKPRDLQNAYLPAIEGMGMANFFSDPVFRSRLEKPPEEDQGAAIGQFIGVFGNASLTWDDLDWLRARTSIPILLKGVLHPDDAREARDRGVDGLVVSNHGGRQVDGAIPSLDALPPIADAVGGEMKILLDSGIRSGADAFKALALGADAVLLGRPYLWGMALEGADGVETVLNYVLAELDLTLGLSGFTSPDQLTPEVLDRA